MNISLRTQVVTAVVVLALGVVAALSYVVTATGSARESILRLHRDRLSALGENLARRYGSVIGFVAEEQFADSSLAERTELTSLMQRITEEELRDAADISSGFFHSIWKREIAFRPGSPPRDIPPAIARVLQLQVESTLESGSEQWSNTEIGEWNILILTRPVIARRQQVGIAWLAADLNNELSLSWPGDITPFVLLTVLIGIGLAVLFLVNLRNEVDRIQRGLADMSGNIASRLPESPTELGKIAGAINWLAATIVAEQREREELQRSIQHKEKLVSLGKLVAGVAHEIRSPLAIIRTRIQLWQRQLMDHRGKSGEPSATVPGPSMQMVVDELDRIEHIVRKLLYFARKREPKESFTALSDVVSSTMGDLHEKLQAGGVTTHIEQRSVLVAAIDEAEAREILLSLVTNALEAMTGGGTLTVTTLDDERGEHTGFEILDSGPGIDEKTEGSIFDPFFTTKDSGTGLGLSIAYEIVRSYGGSLEHVPSTQGARFKVLLPVWQGRPATVGTTP